MAQLRSQQQRTHPATIPAPTNGIDTISNLYGMDIRSSIATRNIDAATTGLKVRPGYNEYANGFLGLGIQTILPFKGSADDNALDALFAANSDGLYDITLSTTTPVKLIDWPIKTAQSGRMSFTQVTNDAGAHFLLAADEINGLYIYTESTGLWTIPTITGPTGGAADIVFVMSWKQRVWYIEKDSTSSWYTDVGTFFGTVTEFNFGSRFRYGGNLSAIYDWTLDSGEGPDDYLVAVSRGGDVIIYGGTDPSSTATFGIIGLWFVGEMPFGRRIGSLYGGDLLLLSTYGLISLTALTKGVDPFSMEASLTWKIQSAIQDLMIRTKDSFGWEIKIHPNLSRLIISTPKELSEPDLQFIYELNLKAWSIWSGMPILTSEQYRGESYIGSTSVSVWKIEGTNDDVTLAAPVPQQIDWELLTSYQDLGSPEIFKRVQFLRPIFISSSSPSYDIVAKYDYDLTDIPAPVNASAGAIGVWDVGLWDIALWGGGFFPFQPMRGSSGMGKTVAIRLRGRSLADTTLIAIGILWDDGGMLGEVA